ncbi:MULTISPECIES: DUF4250 domain-containing protein [Caproicibacterium]|jgi:hypothetical protein|uniref:DUF4250 domain-containing protein n=1 Tax=Caproicibacterium lactatifermentans TaxID=2666138 RepID=A0ABX6PTX4_9FIRM|nr:DUF4250 domain-containing protein [Caproicibacterium lactatifermentans]ARP50613.1 DUF4250 domain-containing protein [Ruminococcaceae bacterium CPB6]MDD4808406.1 DUF4250 domain-containing protein [Oscillospiraceae bacterium]QKO29675.1 DUF4250 domain-containing protein [Caproicibacterium lactatifermentans]
MCLPKDASMLLSVINTRLRDTYSSLDELCSSLSIDRKELEQKLSAIDYVYDADHNQFV